MSSFSEESLEKKLVELNQSQQSIQGLSLWIIHHRKHHSKIVSTWQRELYKASNSRKLVFLYLANDVVQNSRKKAPEFSKEFGHCLKKVLEHLTALNLDERTVKSISRLVGIWKERNIFDPKVQEDLGKIWSKKSNEPGTPPGTPPLPKKPRKEVPTPKPVTPKPVTPKPAKVVVAEKKAEDKKNGSFSIEDKPEFKKLLSSSSPATTQMSPIVPDGDPPEPEDLIKAIQALENSASSDAIVREKIARLPPEVSEAGHLEKLQSAKEGKQLLEKIKEATDLLNEYNDRLQQELKDRKKVGKMIVNFLASQSDLLTKAEENLELHRDKLDKVNAIRDDLKSHISSLPDMRQLPDITGGLTPLPSAGDLFMK